MDKEYTYKVKKAEESKVTVEVKVQPSLYKNYQEQAYNELAPSVKIAGFRAGKAPRAQIESKISSDLFSRALKLVITNVAAEIVDTEELNPATQLAYDVSKVSDGDGVEFKFEFTNYPEVKLGDLSKLTYPKQDIKIEDAEVDQVITNLFKQTEGESKDVELKNITNEMVLSLGLPGVNDLDSLRAEIAHRLTHMKEDSAEADMLSKVVEDAVNLSDIPTPKALVEDVAKRVYDEYIERIEKLQVNVDEFLTAQGKSRDALRLEKEAEAAAQIKRELLFSEIVRKYELIPTAEEIEKEITSITDPEIRESYDNFEGRRYIASVLIQRRALQKLKELARPVEVKESKPKAAPKKAKASKK